MDDTSFAYSWMPHNNNLVFILHSPSGGLIIQLYLKNVGKKQKRESANYTIWSGKNE